MLQVKLKRLDRDAKRRKEIALAYAKGITHPLLSQPITGRNTLVSLENHVFHLYAVRTEVREAFRAHLANTGVETLIHYPIPPHRQQAYSQWNKKAYPLTEAIHRQVLSLPVSPVMTDEQANAVIAACNNFEMS